MEYLIQTSITDFAVQYFLLKFTQLRRCDITDDWDETSRYNFKVNCTKGGFKTSPGGGAAVQVFLATQVAYF